MTKIPTIIKPIRIIMETIEDNVLSHRIGNIGKPNIFAPKISRFLCISISLSCINKLNIKKINPIKIITTPKNTLPISLQLLFHKLNKNIPINNIDETITKYTNLLLRFLGLRILFAIILAY